MILPSFPRTCLAVLQAAVIACTAPGVLAGLAYEYQATSTVANQDPTTQGWTRVGNPSASVTEGAADVSGTPVWFINDAGTISTDLRLYRITPLAADATTARTTDGWVLETELRVVNTNDALDQAVIVGYEDGTKQYFMRFGSNAAGDPVVRLGTTIDSTYTIAGGAGTFNRYALRYDPVAQSADLFVNGVEVYSNYVGPARGVAANVAWGSGDGAGTGHGQFNRVSFTSPIPEPGSMALLGVGGGLMAMRLRRLPR